MTDDSDEMNEGIGYSIGNNNHPRYPYCVVWTPLPCITWLFPIIGHMGICHESGIIRDFQGPYSIGEGQMAFGNPTKYWRLDPGKIRNPGVTYDSAVTDSCEEYKKRMHILCWDNCHNHVAYALNRMKYNGHSSYNMVSLCFLMLVFGKYTSFGGFLKSWLPFMIILAIVIVIVSLAHL